MYVNARGIELPKRHLKLTSVFESRSTKKFRREELKRYVANKEELKKNGL